MLISLTSAAALAQAISGRVTDARVRQPLPFVNPGVMGKALGTVSNEQGPYGLGFEEKLTKDLGAETGTVIYLKHQPIKLLHASFNVACNRVGTVTLRVNLYRLDAQGRPTNGKLRRREVLRRTTAPHGPIAVDLAPDNLLLSEDFFLSLEWVGGANAAALHQGLAFSAGIGYADNDSYFRGTSQASWERISAGPVLAGMQPKLSFYITAQD